MCKKKKKKKKKLSQKVPNSCLGSAERILLPPNGHEMKPQTTFHLLKSEFYWCESLLCESRKTGCFIDYQKQVQKAHAFFMLQLSAKQINSHVSQAAVWTSPTAPL